MAHKMKFADGAELALVGVTGGREYHGGILREMLEFRIDPSVLTLDGADARFTAALCGEIALVGTVRETVTADDGTETEVLREVETPYSGFSVRVSLSKREVVLDGTSQTLICVKMGQQTALERQLAELETANNILLGLEE